MLISHVNEGRVVLHHVSYSRVKGLIICKTHCNSFFLGSFFEVSFTRPIAGRGGASGGDWGLGVVLAESVSGSLLSVHVSTRKGRSQKAETQGGFRCKQIMSLCTAVHSRKRNCGVDFFSERSLANAATLAPLARLPQCVLCVYEWFSTLFGG